MAGREKFRTTDTQCLICQLGEFNVDSQRTPVDPDVGPDLPIEECRLDELPLETVILRYPDPIHCLV